MYIGWCDGVQACDGNAAHATRHMLRAETLAVQTGSLGAPGARITGPRMETCWCDRNTQVEQPLS